MAKKFFSSIFILGSVFFIICFGGLFLYVQYKNSKYFTADFDLVNNTVTNKNFNFVARVGKVWQNDDQFGTKCDFYLINNSKTAISRWKIILDVPENVYIRGSWNGDFTARGNTIEIVSDDTNKILNPNSELVFGFVIYADKPYIPGKMHLEYFNKFYLGDNPLFWILIVVVIFLIIFGTIFGIFHYRFTKIKKQQEVYRSIIEQSLVTFARIIDAKDPYTQGHSLRVAMYTKRIAEHMHMSVEEQEQLFNIALLHDIGKIGISDNILNKPNKLSEQERYQMQQHTDIGGDILKDFTSIPGIADGARYHHERYDGVGYNYQLARDEIPLCARIICIADSFDAMASNRCYRAKLPIDLIKQELINCSGTQFDPEIVKHMIDLIDMGVVPISIS